jgi:hypothetical protein
MKKIFLIAACGLALAGLNSRGKADPEVTSSIKLSSTDTDYTALAKVKMEDAAKAASQATHGNKVISAALAANGHADGTSYLIWDVDTVSKKKGDVTAVFIDAGNGKVVGTQAEDWAGAVEKDKKEKTDGEEKKDPEDNKDGKE